MAGSGLMACSLLGLALAKSYPPALLAVVLTSGGWSLLINVGNVLTPLTFGGDVAYATNLANVFFGMGAFFTPLVAAFLVRRLSFATALILLGILTLIPAALATGIDFASVMSAPPPVSSTAATAIGSKDLLADPILWLCGLALFFYGPMEASMAAWTTTYLGGRGVSETIAAGLLSAFWLTYMATRLITAFSLPAGGEATLIFVLALGSIAVLSAVVFSRTRRTAVVAVLAAGLIFGPIFPTIMAVLLGHFDKSVHGRAVGLFFAIGGIGWTTIPALIGAYARRTSVQRGFLIAVAAAVGLSVAACVLLLLR